MIRRIRKRFIRIAMLVLTLTMLALAFTINIANWVRVRAELSETIGYLTDNLLRTGEGREGAGGKRGKQKRLLVSLFSLRAIHPLIENAVRQKQFITDAGHELKTPLTAISANMDVLELDIGENEWIRATRQQIAGMGALIKEMIYLSRMDEDDSGLEMADFNLSKVVLEIAEPFEGMAEYTGRNMKLNVQDNLYIHGNEAAVQRLVSILCDNAVKYAPEGDEILLELSKEGKQICLMTENAQSEPLPPDELKHLFDRFYRGDKSRSKESGGFGIGLSVARAVMEKHGGTIQAVITQEGRMRILCKFRSFVSGKRP